jgi:membrane associated rhomboid family serine protease
VVPAGGRVKSAVVVMGAWVALLWILEVVDTADGHSLDAYGIRPRTVDGLIDIVPAAFLHYGFDHLMANTLPLMVLGFLTALRGIPTLVGITMVVTVTSGLGVWFFSPTGSSTLGASGVVFGLFGYLLVRGFVDRRITDIAIGVAVAVCYGSILWGVLPTDQAISWQGHLFGLFGGILAAFLFSSRRTAPVVFG